MRSISDEPNDGQVGIDSRYRTMLILWFALVMNVGALFVVSLFVPGEMSNETGAAPNRSLSFVFAAVGTLAAVLSFVVKGKLLRQSVEQQNPALVQTALTVSCALCEVPALLGVMERFVLTGRDYYLLFLISVGGMALHFPRRDHLLSASYKDSSYGAAS